MHLILFSHCTFFYDSLLLIEHNVAEALHKGELETIPKLDILNAFPSHFIRRSWFFFFPQMALISDQDTQFLVFALFLRFIEQVVQRSPMHPHPLAHTDQV